MLDTGERMLRETMAMAEELPGSRLEMSLPSRRGCKAGTPRPAPGCLGRAQDGPSLRPACQNKALSSLPGSALESCFALNAALNRSWRQQLLQGLIGEG